MLMIRIESKKKERKNEKNYNFDPFFQKNLWVTPSFIQI